MKVKNREEFTLADFVNFPDKNIMERAKEFGQFSNYMDQYQHNTVNRVSFSSSGPTRMVRDNYTGEMREMIYLASNDYLNLTAHPKVKKAGIEAIQKYGTGAGSAPLIGGRADFHLELEKKIAAFKGCESALLYTSGYGSNISTLLCMLNKSDVAIVDTLAHASLLEGCKNTNLKFFSHNDMESLESVLKRNTEGYRTKMIVIDGVYSMDGDIAPLDKIVTLAKTHGAYVMVDEAHATGVLGKTGRGTPEYFDMLGKVDIVCGTFSKALGAVGGFVASNAKLINLLRFYSRGYVFTTAMPPSTALSISAAIDVIQDEPERIKMLWRNVTYFRKKLQELGYNIGESATAIFPLMIGDDHIVKEMCRDLNDMNIYINPVVFPAVSRNSSRLRVSLMAGHTLEQLDKVLDALELLGVKYGIISQRTKKKDSKRNGNKNLVLKNKGYVVNRSRDRHYRRQRA